MAISLGDAWDISRIRLLGQSVLSLILSPRTVPKVSANRPDYLFQTVIGIWGGHPCRLCLSKDLTGQTTDNGVEKRSQAGLSLLDDMNSSARGFCAVLSGDLVAQESSLE